MSRSLVWLLVGLALEACQTQGGSALDDCPALSPCDEASRGRLPLFATRTVALAAARPLWPGCPSTMQVMAPQHPILFRAIHPEEKPDTVLDPADWICELPEPPLLRAGIKRPGRDIAGR
jgi:hypothetical protein